MSNEKESIVVVYKTITLYIYSYENHATKDTGDHFLVQNHERKKEEKRKEKLDFKSQF